MPTHQELSNFIWQIADLLRGPYRPPQYERVMLPMTVLRRFDCVLEPTKEKVLAEYARRKDSFEGEALDSFLNNISKERFHNHSPLTFEKLKGDPDQIHIHLVSYINGFSANVRRIFEYFEFANEIEKMHEANILYLVVSKFCDVDLHPDVVDNIQMGLIFEDLIRRFNELANETAGDHFTPRDVIHLMVDILFDPDDEFLAQPGTIRKMLDPTCGTGGMLAEAQKYLHEHHSQATLYVYGQDFNNRAYAMAASDLLIKGHEKSRIEFGDSLINDKFKGETFDYFLANPPFGVDWKKQQKEVVREHEKDGFAGRFGAGVPRVNDGALLFLQHMVSKFEPVRPQEKKNGSRLAIVFNGSPLFTGGAGSGESNIRRWIIENDWLEAIIALPEQMFYNTGIGTYIWVLNNRKGKKRKGKIQLIDARERWKPMRRSLGDKRRFLGEDDRESIVIEYGNFEETETSKIFDNEDFGYTRVTIERPLRLKFQIDTERKARFLDACPQLLDDIQAIDKAFGRKEYFDWNTVWQKIESLLKERGSRWKAPEQKQFRAVFAERCTEAAPVVAKYESFKKKKPLLAEERFSGWFPVNGYENREHDWLDMQNKSAIATNVRVKFEADSELRDFENVPLKPIAYEEDDAGYEDLPPNEYVDYEKVPLKEDIDKYFRREVLPHVPEAWMDREKDKVGYEMNFNRYFYRYTPPRPLKEIDADIKAAEERIVKLLKEVTP